MVKEKKYPKLENKKKSTANKSEYIKEKYENIKDNLKKQLKKIIQKTKDYVRFNKNQLVRNLISVGILAVVVFIIIIAVNVIQSSGTGNIGYPIIYQKSNNDIYMLEHNKSIESKQKMEKINGTGYVEYSNTSSRYVLFKNGEDLHIFDVKKDSYSKIADDVSVYGFSDKDSYIYVLDSSNDLYSYDFVNAKQLLDNTIDSIQDYNDNAIIYSKNGKLNYVSFDPEKEDRRELVNAYVLAEISENGKNVIYTNSNNALYIYDVKKDKHKKIDSDVKLVKCEDESCEKIYYTTSTENYSLYYYDGKTSTLITDEIYQIIKTDAKEQKVVYTVINNNELTLKYIYKNNKPVTITADYDYESSVVMIKNDLYYVNSKKELVYRKINNNSLGKEKIISNEVQGTLNEHKTGVYFYKEINEQNGATFYFVEKNKVSTIEKNIEINSLFLSNDKEKIYYRKDVDKHIGTLSVYDGKNSKKIANDVYSVTYIKDDGIYYISEYDKDSKTGTLYRYSKDKEKIDTDISYLVTTTPNKSQNK